MEDRFKKYIGNDFVAANKNNPEFMEPSAEDIKCELQLNMLGSYEKLKFQIDIPHFNKELAEYKQQWVPYLPRDGKDNSRQGLMLWGLEGDSHSDSLSLPEARQRAGRKVMEADFKYPTQLYKDLTSIHDLCDFFAPLGRTFLVKANAGAYFPPHRDHAYLTRDCFRVVVFLKNTNQSCYEWVQDNTPINIDEGNAYYIDTTKVHRTNAWENNSIHLIMNIPKTWENVMKLMSVTKYY
jgi:hypothetical protein|tara:strand:- start:52 stop:765 length:714 start_codon:yes stop_codon:yes gene_type:complete